MAINNKKIISSKIYEENVNKKIFYKYMKEELLPKIKNKCIVMDNVSFHKSKEIIEKMGDKWCCHPKNRIQRLAKPLEILRLNQSKILSKH